ncbi:MAG: acyl carrier protein [Alphaproteobacteria bacterium]|nr:acyl carrier protein [Alphaproteobacteria bacterium]
MSAIESELKEMIVEVLGLEDVKPEDIKSDENLFDEDGLALDSIDALELGVNIQKKYGVKIDPQDKNLAAHFQTVGALAEFIGRK